MFSEVVAWLRYSGSWQLINFLIGSLTTQRDQIVGNKLAGPRKTVLLSSHVKKYDHHHQLQITASCIVKVRQMKNFNNIFRLRLHGNTSSLFKGIFAALVLICFNSQLITSMGVLVLVLVLGGLGELRVRARRGVLMTGASVRQLQQRSHASPRPCWSHLTHSLTDTNTKKIHHYYCW